MKKVKFLSTLAASLLMLTACSSDEDLTAPRLTAEQAFADSDVEIRLSSGSKAVTRSSVESNSDGLFEAEGLGIFLLAKDYLNINPSEAPINWARSGNPTTSPNFSIKMDNVEANAVFNADTTATNIEWTDGKTRYYPIGSWYSNRFYGYYPRVSDANITATTTQRVARMTIDGTQDIIWGRDHATAPEAYSAYYFRMSQENEQEVPQIQFEHKLMRITFTVKAGADPYGSTSSARNMRVKSITLQNVPTVGYLTIADYANSENEGTLSFDWTSNLGELKLLDVNDTPFNEADPQSLPAVTDEATKVGQGFLIPVPEVGHRLTVKIKMTDVSGTEFEDVEWPFELELAEGKTLEAGKSYNIPFTVYGPRDIVVNAKLAQWEDGEEGTFNPRELN